MTLFKIHRRLSPIIRAILPLLVCSSMNCGNDHPPAKPIGINITPHSAVAWANSSENQIVYNVEVEYSDGHSVSLTSGITWSVDQPWVRIDTPSATATCEYSAPQMPFFGPEVATITAETTIDTQTFKDSAALDCF